MEQPQHFEEIDLWLKKVYLKEKGDPFADIKNELKEIEEQELRDAEIENIEEQLEKESD